MICYPWRMIADYADDSEMIVNGYSEADCMDKLIELIAKHGEMIWYSGVTDEDYVDGEYIGRDNFIYD